MGETSSSRLLWVVVPLVIIGAAAAWILRQDDESAGPQVGEVASSERAAIDAVLAAVPATFRVDDDGHIVQLVARTPLFTDDVAAHLKPLSYLKDLQLAGSGVGTEGLVVIGQLQNLESLRVDQTRITDEDLQHLTGLSGLRELFLAGCPLGNDGMEAIAELTTLQLLDLSQTKVNDTGVESLQSLTALDKLYLAGTEVTGTGFATFPDPHGLTLLSLSEAPVSAHGLEQLRRFSSLHALYLDKVSFDDPLLSKLMAVATESFPELNGLFLSETPLTDSAIKPLMSLSELPALSLVGLNGTQISKSAFQELAATTPETRYLVDYEAGNSASE